MLALRHQDTSIIPRLPLPYNITSSCRKIHIQKEILLTLYFLKIFPTNADYDDFCYGLCGTLRTESRLKCS